MIQIEKIPEKKLKDMNFMEKFPFGCKMYFTFMKDLIKIFLIFWLKLEELWK